MFSVHVEEVCLGVSQARTSSIFRTTVLVLMGDEVIGSE